MKNLLKLVFMLIVAGLFFSACKTASITKRHYTKGYYVSHSAKKNKVTTNEQERTSVAVNAEALPQKESNVNSATEEKEIANAPAVNTPAIPSVANVKSKKHAAPTRHQKPEKSEELSLNEPGIKEYVKNPFKLSKAVAARDSGDDARSLLWILIVVLLAVYILGLFMDSFGLGGLIHILGVIVLVLLILWLLKII